MFKRVLFCFCFFSLISLSNAQTCCSGGIPLSNNIGLAPIEKGTLQLGIHYDYNNLNTLNFGTEKLDDNSRLRITHSILLNANYDITKRISIEGLFTWVSQRRKISQFDNTNLEQSSGIGDAVLLLKYHFSNTFGQNSNLNIGIGTKIPLGSTTETNSQGIILNADLQPGSNVWDLVFWTLMSKNFNFRPSFSVWSQLTYRNTGTNKEYLENSSYKFGNEFQAYLGFTDQFLIFNALTNPAVSFKYRHAEKDKISGFDFDNTGGNWISVIPDFSIYFKPNIIFSTQVEIPLYSNVDGIQLTPTYRLTTGLLFRILPKKNILDIK